MRRPWLGGRAAWAEAAARGRRQGSAVEHEPALEAERGSHADAGTRGWSRGAEVLLVSEQSRGRRLVGNARAIAPSCRAFARAESCTLDVSSGAGVGPAAQRKRWAWDGGLKERPMRDDERGVRRCIVVRPRQGVT